MSDAAFLSRLAEAIQAQHEATMRLQELASELVDHCSRMRAFTDRLHVIRQEIEPYEQPIPSGTLDITHMPTMLRGGPVRER
jgi:hypothetical protein